MIVHQFTWTEISTHDSLNQICPAQLALNMSTSKHDCYFLTCEMTCTVRWLTADQHLITNFANRCNSHIRLVSIIAMAGSKEQTD